MIAERPDAQLDPAVLLGQIKLTLDYFDTPASQGQADRLAGDGRLGSGVQVDGSRRRAGGRLEADRLSTPTASSSNMAVPASSAVTAPYVAFGRVGKTYSSQRGPVAALVDISLDIRPREFVSVVGPSGCGKSTLLKLVAGLEDVSSGTIAVGGKPLAGTPDRLGVVFQRDVLLDWRNILDNVLLSIEFTRQPTRRRARTRACAAEPVRPRRLRASLPLGTVGRHAPARIDLPGAAVGSGPVADGRTVRRARRHDARRPQSRTSADLAGHPARPCCSSPIPSPKRCSCPIASS